MPLRRHRQRLEELYSRYNRREFVHPDPLEFLYDYEDPHDREIVALVASSLAYGRVAQIIRSVRRVLARLGRTPRRFLRDASPNALRRQLAGFRHRFSTGDDLAALLAGAKTAIERHGSLGASFAAGLDRRDETVLPALRAFAGQLDAAAGGRCNHLLPDPQKGSACKRLNLFLRWLARNDEVDPGGWDAVPTAKLLVPLDTHMHRIGRALGCTKRKAADIRTAMEITAAFARISPDDPVRYDFALTRPAIRGDMDLDAFLAGWKN